MKRAILVLAILALALCGAIPAHVPPAHAQIFSGHCYPTSSSISISSATGVSTAGGGTIITGTGFPTTGTPQVMVCQDWIASHPGCGSNSWVPLTVTSSSATQIVATVPALSAGTYDILVSNRTCGSDFAANTLEVQTTSDFSTVFSGHVEVWVRDDSGITCGGSSCANGGTVDSWPDKSGNGHTLTGSGTARGTYNTSCTYCTNPHASVTFNGTSNLLKNTSVNANGATDLIVFVVLKELTNTNNKMWAMWGSNSGAGPNRWAVGNVSGAPGFYGSSGANATFSTAQSGGFQVYGGLHGSTGAYTASVSAANAPAATGANAQTWATPTTGTFAIGGSTDSTTFSNIEVVEAAAISNVNPTVNQYKEIAKYLNLRYFNYSPTYSASTVMVDTGTGFRTIGSGFISGMTADFVGLGVSTQTATLISSSRADIPMTGATLVPGNYDLTLTNPDGGAITVSGALGITSTVATSPMTVTGDLSCVGWYQPNGTAGSIANAAHNYTIGTGVSDLLDQSLRGNDLHQGTGANQPPLTTSDANYPLSGGGNANSMSFDGVAQQIPSVSNFVTGLSSPGLDVAAVARFDSSLALQVWLFDWNAQTVSLEDFQGKPRNVAGGVNVTWGSSIAATSHGMFIDHPAGANPTISVNVDNGTAVTLSTAVSALTDTHQMTWGAKTGSTNFYKGSSSCLVVFDRTLTGTEQANLKVWEQASCGAP